MFNRHECLKSLPHALVPVSLIDRFVLGLLCRAVRQHGGHGRFVGDHGGEVVAANRTRAGLLAREAGLT